MFTAIIKFSLQIIVAILPINSRFFYQIIKGFQFIISVSIIFSEILKPVSIFFYSAFSFIRFQIELNNLRLFNSIVIYYS